MVSRSTLLEAASCLDKSIQEIKAGLATATSDTEEETFAFITTQKTNRILQRVLSGEISFEDFEEWANLVECNDSFRFEKTVESVLRKIIFEAANPELEGQLTSATIRGWLHELKRHDIDPRV